MWTAAVPLVLLDVKCCSFHSVALGKTSHWRNNILFMSCEWNPICLYPMTHSKQVRHCTLMCLFKFSIYVDIQYTGNKMGRYIENTFVKLPGSTWDVAWVTCRDKLTTIKGFHLLSAQTLWPNTRLQVFILGQFTSRHTRVSEHVKNKITVYNILVIEQIVLSFCHNTDDEISHVWGKKIHSCSFQCFIFMFYVKS